MNLLVIGLNHKTADLEVRENIAFADDKLEPALKELLSIEDIHEAIILSTCNRVEIYTNAENQDRAENSIKDFISRFHCIDRNALDRSLFVCKKDEAIQHIFRVASSLDSMVVGEPQILGQLKDAYEFALNRKKTGILLNKLLNKAISVAKRVRTETRIAENAVSISFAAVELARKIFDDISTNAAMLLGAGEMAELAARHLISAGIKSMRVANRTYSRGVELAGQFCGTAVLFEDFLNEMEYVDIVICSTGASNYVLTAAQVQDVMKARKNRPIFLIDISVPRNIDPMVNELDNVYLYDVDDLQGVIETNLEQRRSEAAKAEAIVTEEVACFKTWMASLDAVPTVIALRERAEVVRQEELAKAFNKLGAVDARTEQIVKTLANNIVNKLLHPPTVSLRTEAADKEVLIELIRKIYRLDNDE